MNDPSFIITHSPSNTIATFLNDGDAPLYKNLSDQKLKRKQDAAKSISIAFKDSRFGGVQEVDWERRISDFEKLSFDYKVRSNDLAYLLRSTDPTRAGSLHVSSRVPVQDQNISKDM